MVLRFSLNPRAVSDLQTFMNESSPEESGNVEMIATYAGKRRWQYRRIQVYRNTSRPLAKWIRSIGVP